MNIHLYKQRLLDLEKTLSGRIGREADQGRGEFIESAHDVGDASVADEVASEEFTEADSPLTASYLHYAALVF